MKLFEVINGQYEAEIQFISRHASRRGQYSTIGVKRALERNGYKMEPVGTGVKLWDKGDKSIIQKVVIKGTRDEVLAARKEITRILKSVSQGIITPKFKVISKPNK